MVGDNYEMSFVEFKNTDFSAWDFQTKSEGIVAIDERGVAYGVSCQIPSLEGNMVVFRRLFRSYPIEAQGNLAQTKAWIIQQHQNFLSNMRLVLGQIQDVIEQGDNLMIPDGDFE